MTSRAKTGVRLTIGRVDGGARREGTVVRIATDDDNAVTPVNYKKHHYKR